MTGKRSNAVRAAAATIIQKAWRKKNAGKLAFKKGLASGFVRKVGYYGRYTGSTPEQKFFDTDISFQADTTAKIPATGQLCLIPQGDTQSQRNGRKCVVTAINFTADVVYVPGAAAAATDTLYLYIILDSQCNGSAATVGDVNTGIFTNASLRQAQLTLANSGRFKILKKWVIPFNCGAGVTTAYNNMTKHIHFYKKCNIPLEFDGAATTGALTTIRSNNIFLVAGSGSQSDDLINVAGSCRLRFMDV